MPTGPSSVGTCASPPRTADVRGARRVVRRSSPLRSNVGSGRDPHPQVEVAPPPARALAALAGHPAPASPPARRAGSSPRRAAARRRPRPRASSPGTPRRASGPPRPRRRRPGRRPPPRPRSPRTPRPPPPKNVRKKSEKPPAPPRSSKSTRAPPPGHGLPRRPRPAVGLPVRPELVVLLPLLLVAEHLVGLADLLEASLGLLVPRVHVRVVLARELPVRGLDLLLGGASSRRPGSCSSP